MGGLFSRGQGLVVATVAVEGQEGEGLLERPYRGETHQAWLASVWMRRGRLLLWRWGCFQQRFAAWLRRLPRRTRRVLRSQGQQRRVVITLASAALMLALSRIPVQAATITVVNREVAIADNGLCSLKEAIGNANDTGSGQPYDDCAAGNPAGMDTIELPVAGSFTINAAQGTYYESATGLPQISSEIVIEGNGAIIRRLGSSVPFRLLAVASSGDLTLHSVTVRGGYSSGTLGGGGIVSAGQLSLDNSIIANNKSLMKGGGISALSGALDISGGVFSDNTAEDGGGLYQGAAVTTITASSFEENKATGSGGFYYDGRGGGIWASGGMITILNSSFSGNQVIGAGAGLYVSEAELTVERSLFDANEAERDGGGIFNLGGVVTIFNSTLSGNTGSSGGGIANQQAGEITLTVSTLTKNQGYAGGGLSNYNGEVTLRQSLLSGNQANRGAEVLNSGTGVITAAAHNLFGHSGYAGLYGLEAGATDVVPAASLAHVIDLTLRSNGGTLPTHALVAESPAVDAAPSALCLENPINGVDQRGRPRNVDGDGSASPNECDIGAFEQQAGEWPVATLLVVDGEVEAAENGRCSLIEAIDNANDLVDGLIHDDCAAGSPRGSDVIQLPEGGMFSPTVPLVRDDYLYTALPAIRGHVVIEGNGSTLGRKTSATPFRFLVVATDGSLTLNEVTLTGGYGPSNPYNYSGQNGGAIVNYGALTITGSTLSGNSSGSAGGAVSSEGPLTITNSVFSENQAAFGGAVINFGDLAVIKSSEFSDNAASYSGGGLGLFGISVLHDLTITDNSAMTSGGGLDLSFSGHLILTDSTVSGNSAKWGGGARLGTQANILNSEFAENEATELGGAIMNGSDVRISHSVLSGNAAGEQGGAIYSGSYQSVSIVDSYLTDNQSGNTGGGLTVFDRLTVSGSVIAGNETGYAGGGIQSHSDSDVTIDSSTIADNRARRGGGLNSDGLIQISDSTIAGNQATEWGGGLQNNGQGWMSNTTVSGNTADLFGGGILNKGRFNVTAATFTNNIAGQRGGGLRNDGGMLNIGLSLISGNQSPQGAEGDNLNGGEVSSMTNLWGYSGLPGVAGFMLDAADVVPAVELSSILHPTLADLGGPTQTHGLMPESLAVDALLSGYCTGSHDQRGEPRNADGDGRPSERECDIGAFEQQIAPQRVFLGVIAR